MKKKAEEEKATSLNWQIIGGNGDNDVNDDVR